MRVDGGRADLDQPDQAALHLPRSTLLAMVGAFGGTERVLEAYRLAVGERYRFFSYGDAMLLWRGG